MRKLIGLTVCALGLAVMGQTTPPAMELNNETVSQMKVEDLQRMTFLHYQQTTTMPAMMQSISTDVQNLFAAAKAAHIERHGPLTVLIHGASADPNHSFDLQVGFNVDKGTAAPAGYQVSELPPSKTAVVLYSGPLMQVRRAYNALYSDIQGAGLTPTANIREYILYYEDVNSPNNVAMAGVELQ